MKTVFSRNCLPPPPPPLLFLLFPYLAMVVHPHRGE